MANYTTVFHPPEKDKKKVESPSKSYPFWSNNENLQTHLCIYQYIIIYCIYIIYIYICELINLLTTHPIFSNIVQTWARHLKHRSCIWMNSGAFVNSKSSSNSFKNSTCLSTGNPHTTSQPIWRLKGLQIGEGHWEKSPVKGEIKVVLLLYNWQLHPFFWGSW